MPDILITKASNGLGRVAPNTDNIRGLVMNMGAAAPSGLAVNTAKALQSLADAVAIGIDATYDTTNNVLCYYQIKEFFEESPYGKLWIYLVAQSTTMATMVDSTAVSPVEKLAFAADGEIKRFGIVRNPATGYTPTYTSASGIDEDSYATIVAAELMATKLYNLKMPASFTIEGKAFTGTATAALSMRLRNAPSVSLVIAQDLGVATAGSTAVVKLHAAVGTLLGSSSAAKVSDDIAWVQKYDVSDTAKGRWLLPGLSSNLAVNSYSAVDQDTLNTKGFIFVKKYPNYTGSYWNDSHNCVALTSDYAYMENTDVINKAVRGVYQALLPKVAAPVKVNANGQLASEVISSYESLALAPLINMQINEEISNMDIYIAPLQNIISTSKITVKISVQPIGVSRMIDVTIGLVATI